MFNSPDLSTLSIEDPGMAVLSAREMTALATGNPKIIQQIELQTRLRTLTALRKEFEDARFSSRHRQKTLQRAITEWHSKLERRSALLAVIEAEGLTAAEELGAQLYDLCQPRFEVYDQRIAIGELYGIQVFYEGEVIKVTETQNVRTFWMASSGHSASDTSEDAPTRKEINPLAFSRASSGRGFIPCCI
jgi:hypothetical protein